jgi:AAA family ATP:ADP antiporter
VAAKYEADRLAPGQRALRLFGDVRAGEGARVLLFGLQIFLLLSAYYLLKTVREPLILLWGAWGLEGDELKIYATSAQALLLLLVLPVYGKLASRVPRLGLIRGTLLAFMGSLAVFVILGLLDVPIAVPFYMWLGIVSLFGIAQFWSLAADVYNRESGERLFGIIAIGGSLGAIVGAQAARALIHPLGVYGLMAIAAALYAAALLVVALIERASRESRQAPDTPAPAAPNTRGALGLVLRDPYLLLIGVLLIVTNLVNTQGEYILADTVKAHAEQFPAAARESMIGQFYGTFYSIVNTAALLVQALLVSRLLKRGGPQLALFLLPAAALCGYGAIALLPTLAVVAVAKAAENSLDYSIQNTVEQTLFLPTTREIKYKGKATVDTVCVRLGDMAAGGLVLICLHVFGLSARGFALGNVLLVGLWLVVAAAIARRHRRLVGDKPDPPAPERAPVRTPVWTIARRART